MKFAKLKAAMAAATVLAAMPVMADSITSLNGAPYSYSWSTKGTAAPGSATLSTEQTQDGNASVKLVTNGSSSKAAIAYGGDRFSGTALTLGSFSDFISNGGTLGFDFYVDPSSTGAAHLAPALQISLSNGANLKWEAVYNGFPVAGPTVTRGQWYSIDLNANSGLFWQYNGSTVTSGGAQQNLTLADWFNRSFGNNINSSTFITGIQVEAGGGWSGVMTSYVDGVYLDFGSTTTAGTRNVSASFDAAAVPLPSAAMSGMVGMGLLGLGRRRRD